MWEIYDGLIKEIPEEIEVTDYMIGCTSAYVCAGDRMGICETVFNNQIHAGITDVAGISLKKLAGCIKSWNYTEASLGLAAVNCWYNSPESLEKRGVRVKQINRNPFNGVKSMIENKKAAVVNHIDYIETIVARDSQMSMIEDKPREMGDFPPGAFEYILDEQDFVFADGKSIIRKKLTRLLEKSNRSVLVGIGVPLDDMLIDAGAMLIMGFCVSDKSLCRRLIAQGAPINELFPALSFASIRREDT